MTFIDADSNGVPKSFDQLLNWVKSSSGADTFRTEGDGTATEVEQANFQAYLDGGDIVVVEGATAVTGDALKTGTYGDGTWSDDGNAYTVGASDSVSFTPSKEWVFEVQVAKGGEAATTKTYLPDETFTENTADAVVTLLRVQTPYLENAEKEVLGVFTLDASTHTEVKGDKLAKRGCTDDTATNYDADALVDEGCEFAEWYEEIPMWGWGIGGLALIGLVMGMRG